MAYIPSAAIASPGVHSTAPTSATTAKAAATDDRTAVDKAGRRNLCSSSLSSTRLANKCPPPARGNSRSELRFHDEGTGRTGAYLVFQSSKWMNARVAGNSRCRLPAQASTRKPGYFGSRTEKQAASEPEFSQQHAIAALRRASRGRSGYGCLPESCPSPGDRG